MIKIENEHLLISRFGCWPSFHDAEIVRARFEREGPGSPSLECDIHVFERTSEVDRSGHHILKNHTLVTFRFCDIGLECFKWWNHQNVLSGLYIGPAGPKGEDDQEDWPIEVDMPSIFGCHVKLRCRAAGIIRVEECGEDGQVADPPDLHSARR